MTGPATPHATETVTFHQAAASVTLHTNDPAALTAARDGLYAYRRSGTPTARWRLDLLHEDPGAGQPPAGSGVPSLDIGPGLRAHVHPDPAGHTFWIPDLGTRVRTDTVRRHVTVHCPAGTAARWATSLVRQLMTAQMLTDGAVYAHAAALVHHGRGILIAGAKNQGKTTTLLTALHHCGGDYVTNDRLLLHERAGTLIGYPWPMELRAGIGTLLALPHLTHLLPAPLRHLPPAQQPPHPDKILVHPPGFGALLNPGGTVATHVRPHLLLCPTLVPGRRTTTAEPLPASHTLTQLHRTRLFMADPDRGYQAHLNHWLAPVPDSERTDVATEQVARALAALPCYRLQVGTDTAALAAVLGELLDRAPAQP